MSVAGLVLFVVHLVALVAGGANAVMMPIIGRSLATATPEGRDTLFAVVARLAKVGKYALATLLVSGILVLWLKWGWVVPNHWFWVKMALIVVLIVCIGFNEVNGKKARAGDRQAAGRSKMFGQLTALVFVGVIFSAVFAFA